MSADRWFLIAWCLALGYAAVSYAAAALRHPLTWVDLFLTGTLIATITVMAFVLIFGHDYARALVCAAVIAFVGASYDAQARAVAGAPRAYR